MVWMVAIVSAVAIIGLGLIVSRYGVLTPFGRAFIESRLDGLEMGGFGRLHIEGLDGDVWDDFTVRRATITDARGVWLEARKLRVKWSPAALLRRRVQVDTISADTLHVYRRPLVVSTGAAPSKSPISLVIADARFRFESDPAFSMVRGLFQVAGSLDVERRGGMAGAIDARNLLHPGDGLVARFDVGLHRSLYFTGKASEGPRGALIGLLGLPMERPFEFYAVAGGSVDGGRLFMRALSGPQVVALADGGWTKDGGSVQGRVSLAASSLTTKLLRQLGSEARLSAQGRRIGPDLYDLRLGVAADNLSVSAEGVTDVKRQAAPKGFHVAAAVMDLSRLTSQPGLGPGAIDAQFTGAMDAWRLAGQARVEKLAVAGYLLARMQGPFELGLIKQELHLQLNATGTGGSGRGLLASLAGARPQATLQASRLPSGQILIRALSVDGAGVKVQAAGQRACWATSVSKAQPKFPTSPWRVPAPAASWRQAGARCRGGRANPGP